MGELGTTSNWVPWVKLTGDKEPFIGEDGQTIANLSRISPINSPATQGEQLFRVLAQAPFGRPRWRQAGDLLVLAGVPGNTNSVQVQRFWFPLNVWTLVSVTDIDGDFFLSLQPNHWHQRIELTIERFEPEPVSNPSSPTTAITVQKNAIVNPSFEIWHETANDIFAPVGIQRITLAPGWSIRSWTNQGHDFGTIATSRETISEPALPFTTYLRWRQLTPSEPGGALSLANQVNELALTPGDIIVFHGYARVTTSSGLSVSAIIQGGGHPWTNLGRIFLNTSWAQFSVIHQLSNSSRANYYGLLVELLMPNNRIYDLEVSGLQLEVNGAPTDLDLYLS